MIIELTINNMDIYSLSRNFFDWSFENPEKITPSHTALYFFAIEHCNRLWWKEKFWFPSQMAMEAIGIRSYNTYSKVFWELVEWKFFTIIQKSVNQYSANIIAISKNDKATDKALDKALIKHRWKQCKSTSESNDSIDIQVYKDTNLHNTNIQDTTIVVWDQALVVAKWNTDINELLETVKWQVEFLWLIYKKGKYERERAKNILTWKDFWEVCEKANMSRIEFCKQIIFISSKLDFWNWKVYNAETIYKHYAQVYNEARNKKQELENKTPKVHENPLCRF
jgi:hypothetical protein